MRPPQPAHVVPSSTAGPPRPEHGEEMARSMDSRSFSISTVAGEDRDWHSEGLPGDKKLRKVADTVLTRRGGESVTVRLEVVRERRPDGRRDILARACGAAALITTQIDQN
jgi:hypothetical protein